MNSLAIKSIIYLMQSEILPLSINKRNILGRLSSKKMRQKYDCFLVEGNKSVKDLVDYCGNKFEILYFVVVRDNLEDALKIAEVYTDSVRQRIFVSETKQSNAEEITSPPIYCASHDDMKRISSLMSTPGMIAVCKLPEMSDEEIIYSTQLPPDIYLMLDGIQDPGNLGTIIRTAHWFGIKNIYASKDTVDLYNPKVVQASMGSLGSVEVKYVDLHRLAEANPKIPLIGLLLDGKNLFDSPISDTGFILMGNEGNGISESLRQKIEIALTIPPHNAEDHSESLNVAIATAIVLAHFRK